MARTVLPVVGTTYNAGVDETAGTAVDVANGFVCTPKRFNKLLLVFALTTSPAAAVTVRKGATGTGQQPGPALEAGKGDLVVVPSTTKRTVIGPFTGGRFSQNDGSVNIDFAATTAGTVWAYELTRPSNTV